MEKMLQGEGVTEMLEELKSQTRKGVPAGRPHTPRLTQTLGSLERPGRGPSHGRTAVRAPAGSEPGGGDTWLCPPSSPPISPRWLLLVEPSWTPGSGKGAWEMWFAEDRTQLSRARQAGDSSHGCCSCPDLRGDISTFLFSVVVLS